MTSTRARRPSATRSRAGAAALLLSSVLPLTACGGDTPETGPAPEPAEASTGVPLNVGSEDPAATGTAGPTAGDEPDADVTAGVEP